MPHKSLQPIEAVNSALQVIDVLGQKATPFSFTEIVKETGRPKSSVHRMLLTLVQSGFVERCETSGRYRLGLKVWGLGMMALGDRDLLAVSRPYLEDLMGRTEETVDLAVLMKGEDTIMYVAKVDGPKSVRVHTPVGLISPSWCTATGRSMLADRSDVWDRVLGAPLKRLTPNTVTNPVQIRAILERVGSAGYAVTKGERNIENGGIAAPIRDHTSRVVAACGLGLPVYRMNRSLITRCVPLVVQSSQAISRALGYSANVASRAVK
jgi:DNA-binding IclR family transcriptional regulator